MKNKMLKTILTVLLVTGVAASLCACTSQRNLCPAYNSQYKVEPLPY